MRKRVYIAGPISRGDLGANIKQAETAFLALLGAGFAPFCPHWSCYAFGPDPLHREASAASGLTHDAWISVDLPWVCASHAVLRLPGESVGADLEVSTAIDHNIPVYHSIENLIHVERNHRSRQHLTEWIAADDDLSDVPQADPG